MNLFENIKTKELTDKIDSMKSKDEPTKVFGSFDVADITRYFANVMPINSGEATEQITLKVSSKYIKELKQLARKASYEAEKDISYTDIIRMLIEEKAAELIKDKQ